MTSPNAGSDEYDEAENRREWCETLAMAPNIGELGEELLSRTILGSL